MTEKNPIIDVTPIRHSSSRINPEQARSSRGAGARGAGCKGDTRPSASEGVKGRGLSATLAGIAQVTVGAGLVAMGIPMLILPGPGLLSIGAGVILVARGLAKVTGR